MTILQVYDGTDYQMLGRGLTPDVAVQIEGQCPSVHVVSLADLQYQARRNDRGSKNRTISRTRSSISWADKPATDAASQFTGTVVQYGLGSLGKCSISG